MTDIQPTQREPKGEVKAAADPFTALNGRLGVTVPHEWWPSAHLVKSFEAAGFSHVQVDSPPMATLGETRHVTRHAAALRESLDTTGLSLILHAPGGLRLGNAAGDRAMDGLIDYAVEAGAEQIVLHALAVEDDPSTEDSRSHEIGSLRRAVRRVELNGCAIAIENLAPLYPGRQSVAAIPASLRSIVRKVGSEALGVCLDVGHAHIVAELNHTSLTALAEPVMDSVLLIHAHDNFGARRSEKRGSALGVDPLRLDLHLPPGRGTVPWTEVSQLVARSLAPVILEVHPPFRPRLAELHDGSSVALTA